MGTWWADHPDLEGMARRGRHQLGEENATAEADTEQLRKRRRSLTDLCFEWMSRGDRVTLGIVDTQFEGRLIAAVNDLLILRTDRIEVALRAEAVGFIRSSATAEFPGTTGERSVSSFRAYLGAAEIDQRRVRLVGDGFDVTGVIDTSTDDHWLLVDASGTSWALPRRSVGYCLISIGE